MREGETIKQMPFAEQNAIEKQKEIEGYVHEGVRWIVSFEGREYLKFLIEGAEQCEDDEAGEEYILNSMTEKVRDQLIQKHPFNEASFAFNAIREKIVDLNAINEASRLLSDFENEKEE